MAQSKAKKSLNRFRAKYGSYSKVTCVFIINSSKYNSLNKIFRLQGFFNPNSPIEIEAMFSANPNGMYIKRLVSPALKIMQLSSSVKDLQKRLKEKFDTINYLETRVETHLDSFARPNENPYINKLPGSFRDDLKEMRDSLTKFKRQYKTLENKISDHTKNLEAISTAYENQNQTFLQGWRDKRKNDADELAKAIELDYQIEVKQDDWQQLADLENSAKLLKDVLQNDGLQGVAKLNCPTGKQIIAKTGQVEEVAVSEILKNSVRIAKEMVMLKIIESKSQETQ